MKEYFDNQWIHARFRYRTKQLDNGCIEWLGARSKIGYGQISITTEKHKRRTGLCHRVIWEITHKVLLRRDQYVCHKCDNPACVNIDHLWLGTAKDNSQDMVKKGRGTKGVKRPFKARGAGTYRKHTRTRTVTDETIRAIRAYPPSVKSWYIAQQHNVSNGYVSKIRNGKAKALVE